MASSWVPELIVTAESVRKTTVKLPYVSEELNPICACKLNANNTIPVKHVCIQARSIFSSWEQSATS